MTNNLGNNLATVFHSSGVYGLSDRLRPDYIPSLVRVRCQYTRFLDWLSERFSPRP